ncbi:MAG: glycosyltransferase [Desulfovibrio sp.]|nr:glycosyltransferase [Desulfovibrio sp.]
MNTLVSDQSMADSLYVNWHLLDGLNHDTPYSHEPDSVIHERFYREPLLEAAYRLLSLNRPEYVFHLYGGEPTIHPYFADLVHYLATSGRNVRLILETNGIRQLKYYKGLLHPIAPERMCVRFAVHLKYMDLEKVLTFVGFVKDQKQLCQVIINWVPEFDDKAKLFYEKLTQLQSVLSYGVSVAYPMGGSAKWLEQYAAIHEKVEPTFPAWTILPGGDVAQKDAAKQEEGENLISLDDNLVFAFDDGASCVGINAVQVAADGTCTLGLVQDDQPFAPKIMQEVTLREDLPKAKRFDSEEEAKAWFADFSKRALAYEIEGGPVRNPLGCEGVEQKLRVKLKRLAPISKYQRKLTVYPELWWQKKDVILAIYEALADEASREVFLRRLKAQLFGLSSYLVSSDYAEFCHPEFSEIPYEAGAPSVRRLRFENVRIKDLEKISATIAWYKPALELVLPAQLEWLNILHELTCKFSDYSLYLGQHGIQTVAYLKSTTPRKRFHPLPLRTLDGNPLVSVIVKASDDDEALGQSIESVEQEHLPRYEVILVQDSSVMSETVDELVRKNPWHARAFRFDEDLSLSKAYDAGLDMAQGEYVCFLKSGEVIIKGALQGAIEALEKDKADLALFGHDQARAFNIEGKVALTRYLTGELYTKGVSNKVYRASLIHDYAIEFMDLPGEMEDDLFNLPVLNFASKISCLKGDLVTQEDCEDETTAEERFEVFTKSLGKIAAFCEANGISSKGSEFKAYSLRLFKEAEADFESIVHEADEAGNLNEVLTDEVLQNLKTIPGIADHLFQKTLAIYAKKEDLPKVKILEAKELEVPFEEYVGAAKNYEHTPKLGIVIRHKAGEPLDLLESLVEEDVAAIECLIMSSAQDQESKDSLEEYADLYPNVRLWQMQEDVCFLQSLKLALASTKAEALTFVNATDEVDSDFVEGAIKAFSLKEKVELAVFSVQSFEGEGRDLSSFTEGLVKRDELVSAFFEQEMSFDCAGLVFSTEFLQKHLSKIEPVFIEEGDEYVLEAFKGVNKAIVSQTGMVSHSEEESSALIARKCDFVKSYNSFVNTVEGFFTGEIKEQNSDFDDESFTREDIAEKVFDYIRKNFNEKYLPFIMQQKDCDSTKARSIKFGEDEKILDVQLKILSAESSIEFEDEYQE